MIHDRINDRIHDNQERICKKRETYSTGSSSSEFDKITLFIYHWEVW